MTVQTEQRQSQTDKRLGSRLTKLAKPALANVCHRERVYRLLDTARRSQVVWISAPAGSGKTTTVAAYLEARGLPAVWYQIDRSDNDIASFFYYLSLTVPASDAPPLPLLTAEYLADQSAFVTVYFREYFARLSGPGVLVFDNFQEIESASESQLFALCEALLQGLLQAPLGTTLIFLSREDPPPVFARLRATGQLALLSWQALKLTADESFDIVAARSGANAVSHSDVGLLHSKTDGWVAGLLLLSEHDQHGASPAAPSGNTKTFRHDWNSADIQLVFDYLGYEIFRRASPIEQEILLATALLPSVDIPTAQALVQHESQEAVLEKFARRNFFTLRHANGTYEYHPLFRAFLVSRAEQHFGPERIRELRMQGAQLIAERGYVESAVELLLEIGAWEPALQLLLKRAPQLLDQGRVQTLAKWLHAVPESLRNNQPWVLYWLGMCEMHASGKAARGLLERALALFEAQDDAAPIVQCWCAIVDSMVVEWNDFSKLGEWLHRYRELSRDRIPAGRAVTAASIGSYMSGLLWARPDDPELKAYAELTESVYRQEADPYWRMVLAVKRLLPYHWWAGDLGKFKSICEDISRHPPPDSAAPVTRLLWHMARAQLDSISGSGERSVAAVSEGLQVGESFGVHLFDVQLCREAIWAHISSGDIAAARRMLDRMVLASQLEIRKSYYHHFHALVLIHEGQADRAVEEAKRALDLSQYYIGKLSGSICLAAAHIQQRDLQAAQAAVDESRQLAERMGAELYISNCDFLQAQIHLLCGRSRECLEPLGDFLSYSEKFGVVIPGYAARQDAGDLLDVALAAGYRTNDIGALIRRSRLRPPPNVAGTHWPWPVKIFTLGRFLVLRDGAPLVFSGKAQRKPLELLSALVAHGGRDVGMNMLAQLLWPDTEGDMVRANLRTTLMRLRRLIGDAAIVQQGNSLSLNAEQCWLDVWAFERLCDTKEIGKASAQLVDQILTLYAGVLLPDNDEAWLIAPRERLRAKLLRYLLGCGEEFEKGGRLETAIDIYKRGVESDPLAEDLYRHLMNALLRANRGAEGVVLYQRYRTLLSKSLHTEPTAETKSLLQKLQQSVQ